MDALQARRGQRTDRVAVRLPPDPGPRAQERTTSPRNASARRPARRCASARSRKRPRTGCASCATVPTSSSAPRNSRLPRAGNDARRRHCADCDHDRRAGRHRPRDRDPRRLGTCATKCALRAGRRRRFPGHDRGRRSTRRSAWRRCRMHGGAQRRPARTSAGPRSPSSTCRWPRTSCRACSTRTMAATCSPRWTSPSRARSAAGSTPSSPRRCRRAPSTTPASRSPAIPNTWPKKPARRRW